MIDVDGDLEKQPMGEIDNIEIDIDKNKNGENKMLDELKNDKDLKPINLKYLTHKLS